VSLAYHPGAKALPSRRLTPPACLVRLCRGPDLALDPPGAPPPRRALLTAFPDPAQAGPLQQRIRETIAPPRRGGGGRNRPREPHPVLRGAMAATGCIRRCHVAPGVETRDPSGPPPDGSGLRSQGAAVSAATYGSIAAPPVASTPQEQPRLPSERPRRRATPGPISPQTLPEKSGKLRIGNTDRGAHIHW